MSTIDLILLGFLREEPMGAYELTQLVERGQIGRLLKISKPAIYKSCKRLAKSGYLSGQTVREGENPEKVIYALNQQGEKHFRTLMGHFSENVTPFYLEFNSFLWHVEKLEPKQGLKMLKNLEESLNGLKTWIIEHEKEVRKAPFAARMIVKQYRMVLTTLVKWIKEAIKDYQYLKNIS